MKKLFLSGGLIVAFIVYILFQRPGGTLPAIKPPSIAQNIPTPSGDTSAGNPSNPASGVPAAGTNVTAYKDGVYTGDVADAYYGYVQVQATITGGKITDVQFLDYPSDRQRSAFINSQAMPYLKEEAIAVQSANVDIISGATATSQAFIESLASALASA